MAAGGAVPTGTGTESIAAVQSLGSIDKQTHTQSAARDREGRWIDFHVNTYRKDHAPTKEKRAAQQHPSCVPRVTLPVGGGSVFVVA